MKKLLYIAAPMLSLMLFIGCATGAAVPAPENSTEEAFDQVHQLYGSDLILTGARSYTVRRGDTLVRIAREYYNDGHYYPVILLASRNVVLDPDRIEPGMQLTIPELQRNLNDAAARASIKSIFMEVANIEDRRNRGATARGIRARANAL